MKTGAFVTVTGARQFAGRVLIATDLAMIVAVAADRTIILRRDPASTQPLQWRCAGLPVNVLAAPPADFATRLTVLEARTRGIGQ